ncbi:amidase [Paracoccus sp. FO-3]|uniref:Aryl acylamidase n=2 Tax=unclassified Paracoccus (in: a-proteobacteria) TaxID=2688777 RepID=F6N111_9RHOB|nr:amidase [Paracoccus sp. FO-3]AEF33439.1 aryl acylamidase [Paracoccus sp. M1-1]AET98897.1 amidase [Paracoccus sp. M-1]
MDASEVDLCYLSASEAIAAFKAKKVSPVEILEAQIKRIEAINGQINALTYRFFEKALEQAHKAEALYAKGNATRPLEGITCAIKDFHAVKGEITTFGSKVYEDFRPDQTAPAVERLLDAGAIMHCRTTTPEFAYNATTHSPLWGVTRNPWNPAYSPGGSSGGAGAAVSGGMTTLADGTDGGGSVRIPASCSGIYGFKPPFGRNPTDREHPEEAVLHYGGLARSVADLVLMQNVMSGPHLADKNTLREKLVLPDRFEGIKGWKIALSMDLGYFEVDEQVQKNTLAAAEVFRSLGCTVEEIDLGWGEEAFDAWLVNWEGLFFALEGDKLETSANMLDPFVKKILEKGRGHSLSRMYGVKRTQFEMYEKLGPVLEKYDILIAPTVALPSVKADHNNNGPLQINGKDVDPYMGWFMTYPFNMVSQVPIMSVPTGWCEKTNVPTGMQIVGRTFDDTRVFRASAAFEAATQPWKKRPDISRWA